jgi:carbonic anhydrase
MLLLASALSPQLVASQTTYIMTNASGTVGTDRCLIFSGRELHPARHLWTNANPEYCGFSNEQELLQNKQAVWRLVPITDDSYIITHSSSDVAPAECLIFGRNNTDQFPSRFLWGAPPNSFCGFPSKEELLRNKQAIWKLRALDRNRHYIILHSSRDNTRDECLIFNGNGNATNPSRFLWGPGTGEFCGFPSREALLQNKQAVWTIRSTESGSNCKYKAFAYDNGPTGQASWCGECNADLMIPRPFQSPINIQNARPDASLPAITFNYSATPLQYIHNLHNLKVAGSGSITIGNLGAFDLVEFHFHRPSEEAINNHRSAMVIHLVHENARKEIVAVSILVEEGPDPTPRAKELIDALIRNFPPPDTPTTPPPINADNLLPPGSRDYFRFAGSLTTPPCTEGLTFFVLKTPIYLPAYQIMELARRFPSPNSRDIQDTNDREIVEKIR